MGADTASKKELGSVAKVSGVSVSIGDVYNGQASFGEFLGFSQLSYSIRSGANDRYVYLYVDDTRIDTVLGTTKSGTYNLDSTKEYSITLRTSWGFGNGTISLS